jgi:hypothetical protein
LSKFINILNSVKESKDYSNKCRYIVSYLCNRSKSFKFHVSDKELSSIFCDILNIIEYDNNRDYPLVYRIQSLINIIDDANDKLKNNL